MNFKPGQRVRIVDGGGKSWMEWFVLDFIMRWEDVYAVGCEATVLGRWHGKGRRWLHWEVVVDDPRIGNLVCHTDSLRPLTDPKADAFIEQIKKIAREPAPMLLENAQDSAR